MFRGGDHQLPRPIIHAAHGFDGIHDQVQQHLLQLHPIAENRRKVIRKPAFG